MNDGVWPPVTTISFADATTLQYSPASFGLGPRSMCNAFSFKSKAVSGASFLSRIIYLNRKMKKKIGDNIAPSYVRLMLSALTFESISS